MGKGLFFGKKEEKQKEKFFITQKGFTPLKKPFQRRDDERKAPDSDRKFSKKKKYCVLFHFVDIFSTPPKKTHFPSLVLLVVALGWRETLRGWLSFPARKRKDNHFKRREKGKHKRTIHCVHINKKLCFHLASSLSLPLTPSFTLSFLLHSKHLFT